MKLTQWIHGYMARGRGLIAGLVFPLALVLAGSAAEEKPAPGKTITLNGVVESYQQTELYAAVTGYVQELKFDIGDRVRSDELLVELMVPELVTERRMKKALVRAAQAGIVQAKEFAVAKEAALEKAEAKIDLAKAGLAIAESDQKRWKAEHARAVKLAEKGSSGQATLDEALRQLKIAEFGVTKAKAGVTAAKAGWREARARFAKAQADIARAQADVAVAEANEDIAKDRVDQREVKMPYDGVVIRRLVSYGDLVGPGTGNAAKPLYVVARTDMVRVVIDVPEANALAVVRGARAVIRFTALKGREFAGMVERKAGAIDPKTATRRAEIHLANRDHRLLPGMSANVTLSLQVEQKPK